MQEKRIGIIDLAWLLFWGTLSTAWCWSAAHTIGPTFDEPFYLQAGLKNWHDLNHRELLTQGTMPLAGEVQTLPLRLAEVFTLVDPARDWLEWLPTARRMTIVFWWLLLWAAYRLASQYGGRLSGCLAVAFVACEPILLGHASLATTDVPFTACLLTLIAVFRARRDEPTWSRRLLLPAVWVTLALLAKASALLYVPVSLGLIELERLWGAGWRPARNWAAWRPALDSLRDLAALGLLGAVFLFMVCPRASRGLLFQINYNRTFSGTTYLLEDLSNHGYWYYFLAGLAIKIGLPVLILLATTLPMRPRASLNGPMYVVIGLLALTLSFRIQIGIRYVLPIAALAIVAASATCGRWWNVGNGTQRILGGTFASVLLLWSMTNACLVWPNGICYTNELFGGTGQGYRALCDSNYDWGQGVPELLDWQREHADAPLHVWGFGTDPRMLRAPLRPVSPGDLSQGHEVERLGAGGYLAASTTMVYGHHFNTPAARHLRTLQPCGRTTTFLIYDFRK